jgi:hypothetical protein
MNIFVCRPIKYAQIFNLPQPSLLKRKINTKFLLAPLKPLTNSKDCSKSHIFLLRLDLIDWISQVYVHSWPAFGTTYRLESQAAIGTSSLKRVTRRISQLAKTAETLFSIFFTKRQSKVMKTISAHSKGTVSILRAFKKYSSCDTNPLRNHKSSFEEGQWYWQWNW